MSERIPQVEVPRDLSLAQEVRRQITRHSAEISLNFWQEFKNIRATQRSRMDGERLRRERINTLMRDGQKEANKEAEALSRSISAQGMITLPMASAADPPPSPLVTSIVEGIKKITSNTKPGIKQVKNSMIKLRTKPKPKAENKREKSSPASMIKPRISAIAHSAVANAFSQAPKIKPRTSAIAKVSAVNAQSPASAIKPRLSAIANIAIATASPKKSTPTTSKLRLKKTKK